MEHLSGQLKNAPLASTIKSGQIYSSNIYFFLFLGAEPFLHSDDPPPNAPSGAESLPGRHLPSPLESVSYFDAPCPGLFVSHLFQTREEQKYSFQ